MREEDKPFICYKQGWNIKIVPRNAAGWRYLLYWMLPFFGMMGLCGLAGNMLESNGVNERSITLFVVPPFLVAATLWTIGLIRWTKARSEIIDIDSLRQLKREQDTKAKRRAR